MPIKEESGKWKWGEGHGSFNSKKGAIRQMVAARMHGWTGKSMDNDNNEKSRELIPVRPIKREQQKTVEKPLTELPDGYYNNPGSIPDRWRVRKHMDINNEYIHFLAKSGDTEELEKGKITDYVRSILPGGEKVKAQSTANKTGTPQLYRKPDSADPKPKKVSSPQKEYSMGGKFHNPFTNKTGEKYRDSKMRFRKRNLADRLLWRSYDNDR